MSDSPSGVRIDRRGFLGAAGLAIAGSIAPSALAQSDKPVNIGFIGIGGRGSEHLRRILGFKNVKVTALCDNEPSKLESASKRVTEAGQPAPFATPEWKKLLERKDVDAVISALPCDLHAACYLDAIAAGKDLYGEKPMCLTVEECDKVVEAAKKSDRIVQIGFQRRADPRFIESMKLVHAGELGKLIEGRIQWSNAWGPLYGWFGQQKRSGDWMVEQAVHNWDVMNWAIGSAEANTLPVRAIGLGNNELFREKQPERDVHDYYSAVVEYPGGCIVNIIHSWTAPGAFDGEYTRLIGSKGGIDFNSGWISYRRDLKQPNRKGYKDDGTMIDNTTKALEAFVDSVRTRKPPVAGVDVGREAVLACLLVRTAVQGKRVAAMDEVLKKA